MDRNPDIELQRVYAELDLIASDTRSGAAEILTRASTIFSTLDSCASTIQLPDQQRAARLVLEVCAALVRAQPDMAPLARLAATVAEQVIAYRQPHIKLSPIELTALAARTAQLFVENARSAALRVATIAAGLIPENAEILTHSRSSTVLAAFLEAARAGRSFSVIATESRPGFEGRALAEQLARNAIAVTVVTDAAAGTVMTGAYAVFLGADRVTPEYVLNKVGTRMIALAARERGLRVYALSDTTKFIDYTLDLTRGDERPVDEIWPDPPQGIRIINRYFEPTPLDYFTAIVTEEGLLAPDAAQRRAEKYRIEDSLFDSPSQ